MAHELIETFDDLINDHEKSAKRISSESSVLVGIGYTSKSYTETWFLTMPYASGLLLVPYPDHISIFSVGPLDLYELGPTLMSGEPYLPERSPDRTIQVVNGLYEANGRYYTTAGNALGAFVPEISERNKEAISELYSNFSDLVSNFSVLRELIKS